jgi:hypothetical protein
VLLSFGRNFPASPAELYGQSGRKIWPLRKKSKSKLIIKILKTLSLKKLHFYNCTGSNLESRRQIIAGKFSCKPIFKNALVSI